MQTLPASRKQLKAQQLPSITIVLNKTPIATHTANVETSCWHNLRQNQKKKKSSHTLISYLRIHLASYYLVILGGSKYIPRTCSFLHWNIPLLFNWYIMLSRMDLPANKANQPPKIERYCNLLVLSYFSRATFCFQCLLSIVDISGVFLTQHLLFRSLIHQF